MSTQKSKIANAENWKIPYGDENRKPSPVTTFYMTLEEIGKKYGHIKPEKKTFIHWTYVREKGEER